jgi:two-component system, OmpR family, sensor histidine kinase MprB
VSTGTGTGAAIGPPAGPAAGSAAGSAAAPNPGVRSGTSTRSKPKSGTAAGTTAARSGTATGFTKLGVPAAPAEPDELGPDRPPKPGRSLSPKVWLALLSLRSRVSLLVMVAVGLTVALVSIISYVAISQQITTNLDNTLANQARYIARTKLAIPVQFDNPNGMNSSSATTILNIAGLQGAVVAQDGSAYLPTPESAPDGQGTLTAGAPDNLTTDVEVAQGTLAMSFRTVTEGGTAYRVVTVPSQIFSSGSWQNTGYALVLATSLAGTEWTLHLLSLVFTLVGLLGIIMAGFAGLAVAKTALRPVHRLTVATEYIARTGDLRRIQVTGKDELARLTTSFNTMLEALARSHDHQRRLVADAGHELRTPLTSMRTNLDLLAQAMAQAEQEPDRPRLSAQDRTELMTDVRAQMEELSLLISDLVELSRDEHPSHAVELVDLAEVVERAAERVQRRAPGLHYDLRLEPWFLDGDPAALERAVTNLLDNAAKWSPADGTVTVRLAGGALEVADQGPGIDEADLGHVFERFYRSPEARTMPGSGLGLAIVRQVAENHGGRVAAARAPGSGGRPGGALLGVWLPGSPRPPH